MAQVFRWCTKKPKAAPANRTANQRTPARPNWASVFTQTTVDEEGYPVWDEASTSYVGAIESCEEFGRRLYAEAWQRGWAQAEKKVVLGDGAEWIWNQASLHFPDAVQIVDLYHARKPLWSLGTQLYPNDSPAQKRWVMVRKDKLDEGKIERLVALLRSQAASRPELAEDLRTQANYFEDNKERMRYPKFRKQGLFVWLRGDRSRVQNRIGLAETIRYVLDSVWSQ